MAGPAPPVTQQVGRARGCGRRPEQEQLREAARCLVLDADGRSVPFPALYAEHKAIVLFVRVRRGRRGAQPGSVGAGGWRGCGASARAGPERRRRKHKGEQYCSWNLLLFSKVKHCLPERK